VFSPETLKTDRNAKPTISEREKAEHDGKAGWWLLVIGVDTVVSAVVSPLLRPVSVMTH